MTVDSAAKPYTNWDLVRTVNSPVGGLCSKQKLTMYGVGQGYIYNRKYKVILMVALQQSKRRLVLIALEQNTEYRLELIYK